MYDRQLQNKLLEIINVPQAIDTEKDTVSVLLPPLIPNSLSVRLEPEKTSVVHNNTSCRILFASANAWPSRSTQDPDQIGRSVGSITRPSLSEPEETSIFAPTPPPAGTQLLSSVPLPTLAAQVPVPVPVPVMKAPVASLSLTTTASVSLELPSVSSTTSSTWTPMVSTPHCEALLNLSQAVQ